MYLIQNVHVYAPEDLGIQDVLAGGGKILKVGEKLPVEKAYDITVIDGAGKVLMPGLIDSHVHILGGGGEGGAGDYAFGYYYGRRHDCGGMPWDRWLYPNHGESFSKGQGA